MVNGDMDDISGEGGGVGVRVVDSLNWDLGLASASAIRYIKPLHSTARDWLDKYLPAFPGTSIYEALLQALYELPQVIRLRVRSSKTRAECEPSWASR